ncbi:MAG: exodeoxyribonuclease VII small subunit [Bacteroidota bacterium]
MEEIKLTFEEQIQRIEEIAENLDNSDEPIDELLKQFEEGMKLVGYCRGYLEKTEQKIIEISKLSISNESDSGNLNKTDEDVSE